MKRSEANAILAARIAFTTEYDCVSCKYEEGSDEPSEEYFSRSGCDICPDGLATTVQDIVYRARADIRKRIFDNIYEGQVCGGCLCSIINGDDSDLDFSVTEEDT